MAGWFYDSQNKILLYERSEQITHWIPDAKEVGAYVGIPRTLRNCQLLRWLNYPVSPIIDNYDWPIQPGRDPLPHQKLIANFQVLHPRCFNLSDPGTMKTLSSLWAADWLMRQFPPGECRAIVVCPLTILESVWAKTIFANFLDKRTFEVLHGTPEQRLKKLAKPADFYLVNFDGINIGARFGQRSELHLDGFAKNLRERSDIKICIIDEARGYSDASTKRHRVAREIIGWREYLWELTGTPTPNAPTDAYGLAKLLNNAFGKSYGVFEKETMYPLGPYKLKPRPDGYERARQLLVPAIRIPIEWVWTGPGMTTQKWEVPLTTEQTKLMKELKRDLQIQLKKGEPITAVNEAAVRTKFLQLSMGAVYDTEHKIHLIDAAPRIKTLETIIESTQRKVLIFVPLTSVIDLLYKRLSKKWADSANGWFGDVINGQVAQKDRMPIIQKFESDPQFKWILLDPQSTAHGINEMVCADTVVWYGCTDKGELYTQGNLRAHRPGQKHPVTIFQLVSNPLEQEIFDRLDARQSLQGSLLKMIEEGKL
ncbi:MAG TPA: DEAD/DEAH box helicase [Xanthobacteraceae bacterium]|nr:DEAD/DEAH box helicase [Xanthobacteraceae bacterium]